MVFWLAGTVMRLGTAEAEAIEVAVARMDELVEATTSKSMMTV